MGDGGSQRLLCHRDWNNGAGTSVVLQRGEHWCCNHSGVIHRGMFVLQLLCYNTEGKVGAATHLVSKIGEHWSCHCWGVTEKGAMRLPLLWSHREWNVELLLLWCHREGNVGAVAAVFS